MYKKSDERTDERADVQVGIRKDGRTEVRRTDFGSKLIYPISNEKAGITIQHPAKFITARQPWLIEITCKYRLITSI